MRHRLFAALTFLLLTPALLAAQGERDSRPGIAVFPFTNGGWYGEGKEDLDALSGGVQVMLLAELNQNSALRVVERKELQQYLAEQDLGATGRVEPGTAARIGRIVGARYAVTGAFMNLGGSGNFRMVGTIVDVETSEILKSADVQDDFEDLYDMLIDLAARITSDVNLPALPEAEREARKEQDKPAEAITMLGRAQLYADGGRTEQAIELLRQVTERFPEVTEAKDALRQLTSS